MPARARVAVKVAALVLAVLLIAPPALKAFRWYVDWWWGPGVFVETWVPERR